MAAFSMNPAFESWDVLLEGVLRETIEYLVTEFDGPILERTWGEHNVLHMRHPLSRAVPLLEPFFDLKPTRLSGDRHMPLVMAFDDGASERFGVAPGHEQLGSVRYPVAQAPDAYGLAVAAARRLPPQSRPRKALLTSRISRSSSCASSIPYWIPPSSVRSCRTSPEGERGRSEYSFRPSPETLTPSPTLVFLASAR